MQTTSAGSLAAVAAKNSNAGFVPPVTVKLLATWSAHAVASLPPAREPNPAGTDVKTSESAAPDPEPPGATKDRSTVPVSVPVLGPELKSIVKLSVISAWAIWTESSPTAAREMPAKLFEIRVMLLYSFHPVDPFGQNRMIQLLPGIYRLATVSVPVLRTFFESTSSAASEVLRRGEWTVSAVPMSLWEVRRAAIPGFFGTDQPNPGFCES